MKEGRPSDTAEAMAAVRAVGAQLHREVASVDDPFARHFLGRRYAALHRLLRGARLAPLNRGLAALYDRMLPGAIGYVLTRHRYIDDAVDDAVARGATQVVIVGAGYDSRALRKPALAAARVFEIDHPATQARKKQIVQRVLGALPTHVAYVALDATRGDLRKLPAHGFDPTRRAVFVLEGFLWYMPTEVAADILRAIAEIAAPGSEVIFDHILPSVVDGTCQLEGARQHRAYCARRGEPILWGIDPAQLAGYVRPLGLRLVDDVGRAVLNARYTRRDVKIYPFLRIARAEVDHSIVA